MDKSRFESIRIEDFDMDEDFLEGEILLDEWNTFFNKEDSICLSIVLEEDTILEELLPEHVNGYNYILHNQSKMLHAILNELLKQYPKMQLQYGYDEEEKNEYMHDVSHIQDFSSLLSPLTMYILDVSRDGLPYIGCIFSCKWDDEHAFGAMLHKDRVVEIGGADTAFLSWIAQNDLEKYEQ
ncbi:DUF6985 domain-containing protein [Solibacillus cecembensis]|uniref:DUF6985 domain-containing protein n=1 Tax=Solibacillus cecembensis TaxID=459347 RepID=UPI003D05DF6D